MTLGVVIQARMGSTRLPGKVLKPIGDRLLLDHVLDRLELLNYPAETIVATTNQAQDDPVALHCEGRGTLCFRGDEFDVLGRYYACASQYGFDHIVRLTADNPFTDIAELKRLIELHIAGSYDYTHSLNIMPLGVGAEVFTFAALRQSFMEGLAPNHREHVNEYIQENPTRFKIGQLKVGSAKQRPDLRFTVDTEEDYLRACRLVQQASGNWLDTQEAIALCSQSA